MIVADSSAVVDFLLGFEPQAEWVARWLLDDPDVHAPHILDVEVSAAIRRSVLIGATSAAEGSRAVAELPALVAERYSHVPLLPEMWRHRSNLTAADAAFVTLAELLDAPLITTDAGMAGAPGVRANVIVFDR